MALGERFGGPPVGRAPGRDERLDAHHVALATAFAAHVDDFDDTHLATVIHPGAACLGVLCGLAGAERDGAHALRAFAAGCEAQLRLGLAITPVALRPRLAHHGDVRAGRRRGDRDDAARRRGRRAGRTAWATRCRRRSACARASGRCARRGTRRARRPTGSSPRAWRRRAWPGRAARCRTGRGWTRCRASFAVDELVGAPDRWRLLDNTFKPYPCGIVSHPAIEAGERLARRLRDAPVESVELRCHPLVPELTGNPQPRDGLQARFSTIHGVAAALLDGDVTLAQYADERVVQPDITDLRGLTTLHADAECPRDAAELRVVVGGKELVETVEHARGSLAAPLGWEDLREKAERLVGDASAEALEQAVRSLDEAPSFAAVLDAAETSRRRRSRAPRRRRGSRRGR